MGASSDTSSFLAEQTLLELRYIHRTIERMEQTLLDLRAIPPTVERLAPTIERLARAERAKRRFEPLLQVLSGAMAGLLAVGFGFAFGSLIGWLFFR